MSVLLDSIEKLINERGSSTIIGHQLALAKDESSNLERKVSDLEKQIGKLEAQLERAQTDQTKAKEDLQRLKDEHAEDIRIHSGMEFRRGKRTGGEWMLFCPTCHGPADFVSGLAMCSNPKCKWHLLLAKKDVDSVISNL